MSNDLAGSMRFGTIPDVPRKTIEVLRLSDNLNMMALQHLNFIESAPTKTRLAYAHGRAYGYIEGVDEGGALTGQQGAVLQNAFKSAHDTLLAQLQSRDS
ncbi:hypothetical protein ALP10_02655 [Pseudomonas syringae pv. helianthi]|uniref:Uncharacterized protein n=1 Tax=Pseudomonas syringae pv. helianthi TaxID=251654 RepID=A0A3M6CQC7_9PSED|nr:hypothetical protein [Pseudomonas syringae group genomosp. 7]RMV45591.1 hypothetical protein ALP10_02655 [Pseudomonas syringae pv. helianthi]